jgi:hypothetical protein
MAMGMVHIRHVRVGVLQRFMLMKVGMRLSRRVERAVAVTVVLIVDVWMSVCHCLVQVLMLVALGQVKPYA